MHAGPLMCDYLNRYRNVSGELSLSDRMVNLVEDGIDIAVRIGTLADSNLVARKLGATRRVVVGAPGYFAERGRPRKPADLAGHSIVRFASLGGPNEWRFHDKGKEIRVPVAPHYTTNSAEAALWHVERGGGLTTVLAYQAADALRAGRLQIALAEYEPPPLPIQLVYPATRLVSAKIRAFIDLAADTVAWDFTGF
jgi:DNA-binding transcriptional LysR family regulator